MEKCSHCGSSFPEDQLSPTGEGLVCVSCEFELSQEPPALFLDAATMVGVVAALVPWFLHYGKAVDFPLTVTAFSIGHMEGLQNDFVGIGGGVLGLAAGAFLLKRALGTRDRKVLRLVLCAVLVCLSLYHLSYGIGPT